MSYTYECNVSRRTPADEPLDTWRIKLHIHPADERTNEPMRYEVIEAYIYDVPEPRYDAKPNTANIARYLDTETLDELADLAFEEFAGERDPYTEPVKDYTPGTIRNHPARNHGVAEPLRGIVNALGAIHG